MSLSSWEKATVDEKYEYLNAVRYFEGKNTKVQWGRRRKDGKPGNDINEIGVNKKRIISETTYGICVIFFIILLLLVSGLIVSVLLGDLTSYDIAIAVFSFPLLVLFFYLVNPYVETLNQKQLDEYIKRYRNNVDGLR